MVRAVHFLGVLCLITLVWPSLAPAAEVDKAAEAFKASGRLLGTGY